MSAANDKLNLDDLEAIQHVLDQAKDALEKARIDNSSQDRERFAFHLGFILGRIERIIDRTYPTNQDNTPSQTPPSQTLHPQQTQS